MMTAENPGEIEMTVKITMRLKDWEALQSQLKDAHPSWKLSGVISEMVLEARKVFFAASEANQ